MASSNSLSFPVQVRFGDIDSYGHVNNVTYLSYLENARVQLIHRALGPDAGEGASQEHTYQDLVGVDNFTLVANHRIEYLKPIEFTTAPILVNIWVTAIGGSSFDFAYTVTDAGQEELYAVAASSMVNVSRESGRPTRLIPAQRHALKQWSGEPAPFRRLT